MIDFINQIFNRFVLIWTDVQLTKVPFFRQRTSIEVGIDWVDVIRELFDN